jgi:RNA polymerase sigma-70 factor (ECF subfamily)
MAVPTMPGSSHPTDWLARFHAGDRAVLEALYREHFHLVDRAVARHLRGADRETVVHEVFFKVVSSADVRRSFRGGSLEAWLTTVARNQAIDYARQYQRLPPAPPSDMAGKTGFDPVARLDSALDAHRLIGRFQAEVLPARWRAVFETRFLLQLEQKEAAERLGISRTTLAYQEYRVRALLRQFLLRGDR